MDSDGREAKRKTKEKRPTSRCLETVKERPQKDPAVCPSSLPKKAVSTNAHANGNVRQVGSPWLMWGTENNNYCTRKDKVVQLKAKPRERIYERDNR